MRSNEPNWPEFMMNPVELSRFGTADGYPLVLYYHHVSSRVKHYTALSPSEFRRSLETMLEHYGAALHPNHLEYTLHFGCEKPMFLVTFDDGYRNVIDYGLEILDDLNIKAVYFLVSDAVKEGKCDGIPKPRDTFLRMDDIDELVSRGHRLGDHTQSHRPLDNLSKQEIYWETSEWHCPFKTRQHGKKRLFAYPYGLLPNDFTYFDKDTIAFGTVKSPMRDWRLFPHAIRRTFLPAQNQNTWTRLVKGWRTSWAPCYQ